jgi:hypothetical protein
MDIFMKNFSAVSYQTDSQALITKQTNPFQHQTWKQRQQYWKKKSVPWLEHQAERGNEYCSAVYRALQASCGIQTSMSCKGNCFFDTLKTENLHHY